MKSRDFSRAMMIFVAVAIIFFVRTCLMPLTNDDYGYAFIWDGAHGGNLAGMEFGAEDIERRERVDSFADIAQSMWSHYLTWGGRIFAHTLIQFFIWIGKPYFNVANALIFVGLTATIIFLAGAWKKISPAAVLWIFFCVFGLAPLSVVTMLYLTGAVNYMWMAFFQLLFVAPYVQALRAKSASNSALTVAAMTLLGFCAGGSNEAGALATLCLTIFLTGLCISRGLLRPWMTAGLGAAIASCALMMFAPGNFVRLELEYPNFTYTAEIFSEHVTNAFLPIVTVDMLALIPMFAYFLQRRGGRLTTAEILMSAFAVAGLIVPTAMLFAPEFHLHIVFTSLAFVIVAATTAMLELDLPPIKIRGLTAVLTVLIAAYALSLIYVDVSIYRASLRQAQYVREHAQLNPVPMPPMNLRHRFDKIHGTKTAVQFMEFFAGIEPRPNHCRNALAAQYYGAKYLLPSP